MTTVAMNSRLSEERPSSPEILTEDVRVTHGGELKRAGLVENTTSESERGNGELGGSFAWLFATLVFMFAAFDNGLLSGRGLGTP